jgi:mannose-6-phosphate isomerase-like protein (cupin superfamily)
VNLNEKFELITEYWSPKIAGELNGQHVLLAKAKGDFVWHKHDNEDEMFLIHKGELLIQFRDREMLLGPGDFLVIPKGVEHKPFANEEVHFVLFEPKETLNTGNVINAKTKSELQWI